MRRFPGHKVASAPRPRLNLARSRRALGIGKKVGKSVVWGGGKTRNRALRCHQFRQLGSLGGWGIAQIARSFVRVRRDRISDSVHLGRSVVIEGSR